MAGISVSGLPNTKDYNLGRGALYFASPLVAGLPVDYRHLGNAPEFNVSVEVETLEHQSSLTGLKVTDKEVVISQKISVSVSLDELNFDNVALFFSGATAVEANTVAISGFGSHVMIASIVLGRWYDIVDSAGARVFNIDAADLTTMTASIAGVLTITDDYLVDETFGRVMIVEGGVAGVTATETLTVVLAAKAGAGTVDKVNALTQSAVVGALKFIGENPANSDEEVEYQFHQISLKAEGDFGQISDEFSQMQFTGTAEVNTIADATSSTLTIRALTPA